MKVLQDSLNNIDSQFIEPEDPDETLEEAKYIAQNSVPERGRREMMQQYLSSFRERSYSPQNMQA